MKEVVLKITAYHVYADHEDDTMELITEGQLYDRNGTLYLLYDESELTGMEGCKTRLKIKDDKVRMTRKGEAIGIDTEIHFEKGKRFEGFYDTPYGPVEMEVLTNSLNSNITAEGEGALDIDYDICLKGLGEGRSRLNIAIKS